LPPFILFKQSKQEQTFSLHFSPFEKHSQYFLLHFDLLQVQNLFFPSKFKEDSVFFFVS
jgi:hypothetical protein